MVSVDQLAQFKRALPFALSFALIPLAWLTAFVGGWSVILLPLLTWYLFSVIDGIAGLNLENADTSATDDDLFWYRIIPIAWMPAQFFTVFGLVWYVPQAAHLGGWEKALIFLGIGVMTGTIGINYSHELMHQKNKLERWWADILLAMVLYSHFRSEHLLVHHRFGNIVMIDLPKSLSPQIKRHIFVQNIGAEHLFKFGLQFFTCNNRIKNLESPETAIIFVMNQFSIISLKRQPTMFRRFILNPPCPTHSECMKDNETVVHSPINEFAFALN